MIPLQVRVFAAVLVCCIPGIAAMDGGNCTVDPRCPRFDVGASAALIPHPDCRKFYKCSSGKSCEYFCPANLHFNAAELSCDWPHRACCSPEVPCTPSAVAERPLLQFDGEGNIVDVLLGGNSSVGGGGGGGRPTFNGTLSNGEVQNLDGTQDLGDTMNSDGTFNSGDTQGLQETQNNGGTYNSDGNQDLDGVPYFGGTQNSDGTHNSGLDGTQNNGGAYNSDGTQNFEGSSNFGGNQDQNQNSGGGSPHFDGTQYGIPPSNSPLRPGCTSEVRCPATEDPSYPTLLKHAASCSKFYICNGGQACEVDCPLGLHFNAQLGQCDYPEVACCDASKPCSRSESGARFSLNNCHPDGRCSQYSENPMNPTHLQHEADCSRFYKCAHGMACELTCPPGEHFSVALGRCEFPSVACCDRSIPCDQTSVLEPLIPNVPVPVVPIVPPPSPEWNQVVIGGGGIGANNKCLNDVRCPEKNGPRAILLRHLDCGMFYQCTTGGMACEFTCPTGQHFNEKKMVCDWPQYANCVAMIPRDLA